MTVITSNLFNSAYRRTVGPAQLLPTRLESSSSAGPATKQPTRILLVDDEALLVECQAAVLERYGHLVTTASDPLDALALVRSNPSLFDVVISDLVMPGLDGVELSAAISALSPNLPIIMLTATPQGCELGEAGIRKILVKPAPPQEIHEAIVEVLDLALS